MSDLEVYAAAGLAALTIMVPLINRWVKNSPNVVDDSLWAMVKRALGIR